MTAVSATGVQLVGSQVSPALARLRPTRINAYQDRVITILTEFDGLRGTSVVIFRNTPVERPTGDKVEIAERIWFRDKWD